jgi:hypothetical protein
VTELSKMFVPRKEGWVNNWSGIGEKDSGYTGRVADRGGDQRRRIATSEHRR